jgi:hypothetical protein
MMYSMLVARSAEESQLYIELHPCECGDDDFRWSTHQLGYGEAGRRSVYLGNCETCGISRRFEFVLADLEAPVPPAFGHGDQPSAIVDAGEFLLVARRCAGMVPADPAELADTFRDDALFALETAVEAVGEALKFIPPGADAVPADVLLAPGSRDRLAADPDAFTRRRIETLQAVYGRLLQRYRDST